MKSGWVLRVGAAEFPHHNVMIDRGTLWIGTAMCGAEKAVEPPSEAPEDSRPKAGRKRTTILAPAEDASLSSTPKEEAAPQVVAETPATPPLAVEAAGPELSGRVEPIPAPSTSRSDTPIDSFLRAVAEVATAHGPAESAAHVECLFKFGTPAPLDLDPNARAALLDGNILEADERGVHVTAWFSTTSSAWQKMLRGESGDLGVCGDATLDGWTADLVARVIAKPTLVSAIRRDLRRRGIAAFGMLDS